jgi:isoquinoline 1-oxidoreductase
MLRPISYGAKLLSIDLAPATAMDGVVVARDGDFVGVAAPTSFAAKRAVAAIAAMAKWDVGPQQPASKDLYDYLRQHVQSEPSNPNADAVAKASKSLKQTYHVAYIQHAPMEPRAAVAEWADGKLTVWTGTQNPFGVRGELARAFGMQPESVRVIVPDTGGGFGGKHSGECAVEAARIAQAAKRPVHLRWTREEEFTWAYFRPAGVIDMQASLDDRNALASWYHVNINSGPNSIETPYQVSAKHTQFIPSAPPLRHGSYRGLAATANTFARECFMDELAALAGADPLAFRLAHLEENSRIYAVLEDAAKRFDWAGRSKRKEPNVGIGLACGSEKGSYVACCAEVAIDPNERTLSVRHVCQTYECGAIVNPSNLLSQVQGAIVMGLGAALREGMRFRNGRIQNASFGEYRVPRMEDLPELDVHLLDRKDLPSAGAGETPIICIAPAIANAVYSATRERVRSMPFALSKT